MSFLFLLGSLVFISCQESNAPVAQVEQWDTYEIVLEGPMASENGEVNPFLDMRLEASFTHEDGTAYQIPGFFAADGQAAETGADSGNTWKILFTPDRVGAWTWKATLTTGEQVAIKGGGEEVPLTKANGAFQVVSTPGEGRGFQQMGRLVVDKTYYRFQGSDTYWLKAGADSPENFLAYEDFDGTYRYQAQLSDGESRTDTTLHRYSPHLGDWKVGDPTWQGEKGKGIIGALNYLASQHMNSVYFLTMNIEGDGKDVWPYTSHTERLRFDCSKLDQWEIVFSHMEDLGLMMHLVLQETENERLLDDGDTGLQRQLYFRELIARFGHHLALTWNLGEENGPADFSPNGQTTEQRKAMIDYFAENDPYDHPIVIHTHAAPQHRKEIIEPLLGYKGLDGISMQIGRSAQVHDEFHRWKHESVEAGHPWMLNMDEIGQWYKGALPDAVDPGHDTLRREVLWGSLFAGSSGVEWYFGAKYAHNDLQCEDWRSREKLWQQSHHAVSFMNTYLPFWEMQPLQVTQGDTDIYGLGKEGSIYSFYLETGDIQNLPIDLPEGSYSLDWYDPLNGGELQKGSLSVLEGGNSPSIGISPVSPERDWIVLIKKSEG